VSKAKYFLLIFLTFSVAFETLLIRTGSLVPKSPNTVVTTPAAAERLKCSLPVLGFCTVQFYKKFGMMWEEFLNGRYYISLAFLLAA
jgi:hypothetical protein